MEDEVLNMVGNRGMAGNSEDYDHEEENVDVETMDESDFEEKEEKEVEETETEEPKKDKNIQALDSERARRKKAEAELKALKAELEQAKTKKENESKINEEKNALRAKLLEGDLFDEEIVDKLMATIGEDLISQKVNSERKEKEETFDKEFKEFVKDEMFYDAEDYKEEIKGLMEKGLSMKSAYFALAGENKMSNIRKDLEVEVEQKLLNKSNKANRVNVGHEESKNEMQRTRYTKREQEIANQLGTDIKEVRKRLEATSLDEILKL